MSSFEKPHIPHKWIMVIATCKSKILLCDQYNEDLILAKFFAISFTHEEEYSLSNCLSLMTRKFHYNYEKRGLLGHILEQIKRKRDSSCLKVIGTKDIIVSVSFT